MGGRGYRSFIHSDPVFYTVFNMFINTFPGT